MILGGFQDEVHLDATICRGAQLWLTGAIGAMLGNVAAAELNVQMGRFDDGTVARIDVGPAAKPVFVTSLKGEKKQRFLVRINNSTQELEGQEALDYQKARWPS